MVTCTGVAKVLVRNFKWLRCRNGSSYAHKTFCSHSFIKVFSNFFENMRVVAFKDFHLWSKKGEMFSFKNGVFGTLNLIIETALDDFKINQKMLLKSLCTCNLNYLYLSIKCHLKNT